MIIFLLVLILGAVNNWGIPLAIYTCKFGLFKKRPKDFVGCNSWGVVMDVALAGGINLAILNYLLAISWVPDSQEILVALVCGFIFMVATHLFMAAKFWREWIMPVPWRWNLGGYWHMISETLQMTYAFLPLVIMFFQPWLLNLWATWQLFLIILFLGGLFLKALALKNQTVKFGPLKISGEPW